MLDSLHIKNYRNLKELKIDSVSQINLIAGKNNTGKSCLLEAVAIYAHHGEINHIYKLLADRGEYYTANSNEEKSSAYIRSLSSLFTNREIGFSDTNCIKIGKISEDPDNVTLKFSKYVYLEKRDEHSNTFYRTPKILTEKELNSPFAKTGFHTNSRFYYLDGSDVPFTYRHYIFQQDDYRCRFIRTNDIDRELNSTLYDNIALTDKEIYVIQALQLIEPAIKDIAFVLDSGKLDKNYEFGSDFSRVPIIKLSGSPNAIPAKSMGDGINRILTIILALVNVENGFLLIDEFENGLHYSVQENLWKIIFKLAKDLNVQVFATTHSNDCISSFETVLNGTENTVKGKLIRIENKNNIIQPVEYSPEELEIAAENNIETR